jgi:integrase
MADTDRHGNDRLFVRRYGKKIRIREQPGTPSFAATYTAALEALERRELPPGQPIRKNAPTGTLGWLAAIYFASAEFTTLPAKSQTTRRGIIESCLREPLKPNAKDKMALCPLALLSAAHVKMLRDRRADKPGAANNRLKYMGGLFVWALEQTPPLLRANPVRDVKRLRYATDGFHTWTVQEVKQFEARHAVGTKPRLALALLLYTGARRGDMVTFGRQHVRDGVLHFTPGKSRRNRNPPPVDIPIFHDLARIIEAGPCGDLTFLVTEYGQPFSSNGFGNWFRDRCDEAELPQCSAHGLRKARATIAAERGATDRQLMAMFGWTTERQATIYTRAANRKQLAADGARLLEDGQRTNSCPTDVAPLSQEKKKL